MEQTFKVKNLKNILNESSNEFKPKIGDKVESENTKNNKKAYTDAKNDSGVVEEPKKTTKPEKIDHNKATTDYKFDTDPGKKYKERVHAQAKGYTSSLEEDNGIEKVGEFNDDFYQAAKKSDKEYSDNKKNFNKTGLQSRELPDNVFDKENMYENKKMKVVRFKNTEFLTEEHMISKIPSEMKNEGQVFKMVDKKGNTYIVEWKKDEYKDTTSAIILEHINKQQVTEDIEKMKRLYGFRLTENHKKTTGNERVNESNENFNSTLEKMRKIIK